MTATRHGGGPSLLEDLEHQVTGERKAVVSCLGCAIKDPAVASIIRDHRTHEDKDYLNC